MSLQRLCEPKPMLKRHSKELDRLMVYKIILKLVLTVQDIPSIVSFASKTDRIGDIKMRKNTIYGEITLGVSMNVEAQNKENAIFEANSKVNPYNVSVCEVIIGTADGKWYRIDVDDVEGVKWRAYYQFDES